jgi:hypothetical protein
MNPEYIKKENEVQEAQQKGITYGRKQCGCDGNDLDQFGKCQHDY